MVTMVWVVNRLRLKGPSWYLIFIYISPLNHWGNVAAPHGGPQPQKSAATLSPQPGGKTTKFIRTGGGIGEKKKIISSPSIAFRSLQGCQVYGNSFSTTQDPVSLALHHVPRNFSFLGAGNIQASDCRLLQSTLQQPPESAELLV